MKTINQCFKKVLMGLSLLVFLSLAFSCSQDTALAPDENLEVLNAKSNKSILKTLVHGAAISGANGLDVGPDGNLYVASVNDLEIVVINKNNGKIIKRFGPESGVLGPDDLVFGPDGSLYWTNILVGTVGRLQPDGTVTQQFVAPGVNPIRFSEDGRLFVALDFLGDGLYELDPEFATPPRLIIECPSGFCLGFFNSFDTRMEDGRLYLYGPLFAVNLVIAIDVTDEKPTITPDPFPAILANPDVRVVAGLDGAFENPAAAKFGPDGVLYVLDQAGEVWKVNPDGLDDKSLFTTLQPGLDNMTFDSDGSLYMTNNDEGWVAEILPSGQARIISPGGMILPQGLAFLGGSLYEADLFRLRQFNRNSGQQENNYKGFLIPEGPESLILPMNISADGDNLIVSSWYSDAVQVWNPQSGVLETYLQAIPDVVPIDAVRVNGDIVVSSFGLGGVVYANDGSEIAPLTAASGLATDGVTLWAADQATGQIWQIDFDGGSTTITEVAIDLEGPEGLALDNEGRLLVVEAGASRLSRIDLSTGDVTMLVEGIEVFGPGLGAPPTWHFDGVAVGPSGDIYVSGGGPNVIYKVQQNKVR